MRKSLTDIAHMVSKRPCLTVEIPQELEEFHYYVSDQGHCVLVVPTVFYDAALKDNAFDSYELPIPAKYVLEKGYEIRGGYVVCEVPYDRTLGAIIDEKYDVWE